jgi:hypothetical protein
MQLSSISLGICALRGSGLAYDSDAVAWAAAAAANTGTYTAGDLAAMSTWIAGMKTAALWTKFAHGVFAPYYGSDFKAAQIVYVAGSWVVATNHNFVSGDYTKAAGLAGDGISKFLDPSLLVSTLSDNNLSIGAYVHTNGDGAFGSWDTGSSAQFMLYPSNAGSGISLILDAGSDVLAGVSSPAGLVMGTRTAANSHKLYANGSVIASGSSASGKAIADFIAGAKFGLMGSMDAATGSFVNGFAGVAGMMFVASGFTDQNASDFYTLTQAAMTAAGRQV